MRSCLLSLLVSRHRSHLVVMILLVLLVFLIRPLKLLIEFLMVEFLSGQIARFSYE